MTSFVGERKPQSREDSGKTSNNGYQKHQYKGNINYDQYIRVGGQIKRNTTINTIKCENYSFLDGEAVHCLLMTTWPEIMLFVDLQCWFTVKPEKKERIKNKLFKNFTTSAYRHKRTLI